MDSFEFCSIYLQFGRQVPPGLQFEGTFECWTITPGRTSPPRTALAKFFTLQAQAVVGFSSCGEVTCSPKIFRISYNFV